MAAQSRDGYLGSQGTAGQCEHNATRQTTVIETDSGVATERTHPGSLGCQNSVRPGLLSRIRQKFPQRELIRVCGARGRRPHKEISTPRPILVG